MNKVFGQGRQRGEEPAEMVIINKVERGTKGRAASETWGKMEATNSCNQTDAIQSSWRLGISSFGRIIFLKFKHILKLMSHMPRRFFFRIYFIEKYHLFSAQIVSLDLFTFEEFLLIMLVFSAGFNQP